MSPSSRYHQSMIISKGISFTEDPPLFEALQNRGKELLLSVSRRLMRSYRFPFALLITCDRAEVIAQADGPIEVLERALGLNPAKVREYRYSYEGEEALLRLFMLSAGVSTEETQENSTGFFNQCSFPSSVVNRKESSINAHLSSR